ncbi:hypothetical protein IAU60_002734 [Kwoniella sp. DSM 27419]
MSYEAASNRFTLADYEYDRDGREGSDQAESSHQAIRRATDAQTSPVDTLTRSTSLRVLVSPPAGRLLDGIDGSSAAFSPSLRAGTLPSPRHVSESAGSASAGTSSGTLRLHEHYPPTSPFDTYPPSAGGSYLAPSLSKTNSYSSAQRLYLDPRPLSPLPSLQSATSYEGITPEDERDAYLPMTDRRSMMSEVTEKRDHEVGETAKRGFDEPAPQPSPTVRRSRRGGRGFWSRLIPSTLYTKLLLATILTETVINLAIEANILYRFNEEVKSTDSTDLELENKRRLPIYLIIFGLAHLWQIVLTVIAIRTKNTIQVMSVTAFNYAFLGYAVIQIYELRTILGDNLAEELTGDHDTATLMTIPLNVLTALIIAIVAASCLILSVLSFYLQREFGWQRYRFLGADLMIREYYFKLQVFECVCYFSAFFCAGFGIQFIWLVLNPQDVEYIITWVAFPLLLVFLVIGRFAAKYENKYMMSAFMLGLVIGCAYFIFKLARIWQQNDTTYQSTAKSLTVFDALSLVSLVACAVWGFLVWSNFHKGLKQALANRPGIISGMSFWRARSAETEEKGQDISLDQRRISID